LLRDVLDGPRFDVRRQAAQAFAVGVKLRAPAGGELGKGLAGLLRITNRLVVQIGDVADMQGAHAAGFQRPPHHILQHERAEIPDMRRPIDRRPAAVKTKRRPVKRAQVPVAPGKGVK